MLIMIYLFSLKLYLLLVTGLEPGSLRHKLAPIKAHW